MNLRTKRYLLFTSVIKQTSLKRIPLAFCHIVNLSFTGWKNHSLNINNIEWLQEQKS